MASCRTVQKFLKRRLHCRYGSGKMGDITENISLPISRRLCLQKHATNASLFHRQVDDVQQDIFWKSSIACHWPAAERMESKIFECIAGLTINWLPNARDLRANDSKRLTANKTIDDEPSGIMARKSCRTSEQAFVTFSKIGS